MKKQLSEALGVRAGKEAADAEMKERMEAELEAEREKRVQHLATVGIRRMFQAGLAKGWSAWHDLWFEKVRQQNLLKKAASRLAKPKLVAAVVVWKTDWQHAEKEKAEFRLNSTRNEAERTKDALEAEIRKLKRELDGAKKKLEAAGLDEEAAKRRYQEQLEEEREKRVQNIAQVGIRRMFQGALAKGWSAWHDMWAENRRQQQLLARSAGRLAKPKLVAALSHWRKDWEDTEKAKSTMSTEQKINSLTTDLTNALTELKKVKSELVEAREAALNGTALEAELKRQMEEEVEKEKAKRVEHLGQMGIKRMLNQKLSLGWTAWHGMWEEKVRQERLLKAAASRLAKPKLVAAVSHWRVDWQSTVAREKKNEKMSELLEERQRREQREENLEREVEKLKAELAEARQAMLEGRGQEAELQRQMEAELEAEKQRRIEALGNQGIKRMLNQKLAMGWTAWHGMWEEKVRQQNLLKKSTARLTKPRLIAALTHWRKDWEHEQAAAQILEQKKKLESLSSRSQSVEAELRAKVASLTKELEAAKKQIEGGLSAEQQLQRQMEEALEIERQKRVESLAQSGLKRMMNQKLAMGWTAWHGMWEEKVRIMRMMKASAARLAKPKLAAAMTHWLRDWEAAEAEKRRAQHKAMLEESSRSRESLAEELKRVKGELEDMRRAALAGTAQEAEMERQHQLQLEKEKERRVEQLGTNFFKRLMNQKLAMGWTAWHGMWEEKVRQQNLLKKSASRLAKPKLVAAVVFWRKDWEAEVLRQTTMGAEARLRETTARADAAEAQLKRVMRELEEAREMMLSGRGMEAELERQMLEQLEKEREEERERRVAHMQQRALRRIANKEIIAGWTAWHDVWQEKVYQQNLLKAAASRLAKPKLVAAVSFWKADWEETEQAKVKSAIRSSHMSMERQLENLKVEMATKLAIAEKERQKLLQRLTEMDGGKAAREHELQQILEKEKEKRIEALGSQGLKRMLNQKLAMGWTAWHSQWAEARRQERLMKQSAARLTKPRLTAAMSHWRQEWEAEEKMRLEEEMASKLGSADDKYSKLEKELAKVKAELEEARLAMLSGRGMEAELQRQHEEQMEREKEKRVQHLGEMGIKRMINQKLSMGWTAWLDMYLEAERQRQLLARSAGRLAKPKMVAALSHWRKDWEAEQAAKQLAHQRRFTAEELDKRDKAEAELRAEVQRLRDELKSAREAMLTGKGQAAELERLHQDALEKEKEKRVQHLGEMGIKRLINQKLAMGWTAWLDMYLEKERQKRLLKGAAARLSKPRLVAAFGFWNKDWEEAEEERKAARQAALILGAEQSREQLEAELRKVKAELNEAKKIIGGAPEIQRQMEEQLELEKAKRVEHLAKVGIKRMFQAGLAKGWSAWHAQWEEKVRQQNLLKKSAGRLTKPRLIAALSHWRKDWEDTEHAKQYMSTNAKLAQETAQREFLESELHKLRIESKRKLEAAAKERDEMMRRLTALDGGLASKELEMAAELEREKERRIEALGSQGLKRMLNQKLAMGWTAWHSQWAEARRQERLMKASAGRLAKPKLSAAIGHWRRDWEAAMAEEAALTAKIRLQGELTSKESLEAEVKKLRAELNAAREAMISGKGAEQELLRAHEEAMEKERERRVANLAQVGLRRMFQAGVAKGWSAWHDMWEQKVLQQQLLKKSAARLAKPKLAAAMTHWLRDWQAAESEKLQALQQTSLADESRKRQAAEAEVEKLKAELAEARQAMLEGRGQEAELQRQMEAELEKEKEKRIEALGSQGLKRIMNQKLAMGWTAWHSMWEEKVRQQNLLKKSAGRLAKPKLTAAVGLWRHSWESSQKAKEAMMSGGRLKAVEQALAQLTIDSSKQINSLTKERDALLEQLTALDGGAAAAALELQQALEKEKEKRIEALGSQGLKRILNQKLAMGWTAWHSQWAEHRRQMHLMREVAMRLKKGKLAVVYFDWRRSWEMDMALNAVASEKAKLHEANLKFGSTEAEMRQQIIRLNQELTAARELMLSGKGQEAELARLHEEQLEKEKEKRVQGIATVGIRRMMQAGLAKGWTAWHDMWADKKRQERLLKASAGRLTKPRLAAAVTYWRNDWQSSAAAAAIERQKLLAMSSVASKDELEKENRKLKAELAQARQAALEGRGMEAELQRQHEEQMEREKEKRVQHLGEMGLKRMLNQKLAMGWSAWHDLWEEKSRQQRLLKAAASRLTKPKLTAAMAWWRDDWRSAEAGKLSMSMESRLAEEMRTRQTLEAEIERMRLDAHRRNVASTRERTELMARLTALDGGKAEAEMEMAAELEREREKRVSSIAQVGIRRMMQAGIIKGWTSWHDMWAEKKRQERLLKAAAGRLAKPKLASAISHWRHDWEAEARSEEIARLEEAKNSAYARHKAIELENEELKRALQKARDDMMAGRGQEVERERRLEEELERERVKRVEHLQQIGVKRLLQGALARGWSAWLDQYEGHLHTKRMMRMVTNRLGKPKLTRALLHWADDWRSEALAASSRRHRERYGKEKLGRETAEEELARVRQEMDERVKYQTIALQEARMAAAEAQRQMAEYMQRATMQGEMGSAARKQLEDAKEEARQLKLALKLREEKEETSADQLAKMLADQRTALNMEAKAVREALEEQLREATKKLLAFEAELTDLKSRPPPIGVGGGGGGSRGSLSPPGSAKGVRGIRLKYDPNVSVIDQLRAGLAESNTRVLDLFREWDKDGDGKISKKDFNRSFLEIAPDFPPELVDATFDECDPDKSGEIEFNELDKLLRRRGNTPQQSAAAVSKLKLAAKKSPRGKKSPFQQLISQMAKNTTGTDERIAIDDVEGSGDGDFILKMKKRAKDYYSADADGDSLIDFDEFCQMVAMRDDAKDFPKNTLRELFDVLDLDKSGKLDLAEYINWALRESLAKSKGKVIDLFRMWDEDKSGAIDLKEFSTVLFALGFQCNMRDAKTVFATFDKDGGGTIEYEELNKGLRKGTTTQKLRPTPPPSAKGPRPNPRGGRGAGK